MKVAFKNKKSLWRALTITVPEYKPVLYVIGVLLLYVLHIIVWNTMDQTRGAFYTCMQQDYLFGFLSLDAIKFVTYGLLIPLVIAAEWTIVLLLRNIKEIICTIFATQVNRIKTLRSKLKVLPNVRMLPLTEAEFQAMHFETVNECASFLVDFLGYTDYTENRKKGQRNMIVLSEEDRQQLFALQYKSFRKFFYWEDCCGKFLCYVFEVDPSTLPFYGVHRLDYDTIKKYGNKVTFLEK